MANNLIFKDSEVARDTIISSQKKEIAALYNDWANDIGERANFYSHKTNASAPLSERYYRELQGQIKTTSQQVSNEIYNKITSNIYTVADAVVSDNVKWLQSFGFSASGLNAAFSFVPDQVVRNLITGQIYDSGWSLSSRIWGDNEQTLKDIYQIVAKGIAEQKPLYQIAKELESYVRPGARLPWNLTASDGVKIFKKQIDYNTQRLARTLVQHGYQQSFIATTQKNPFITEYIWRSNGSRVCELCSARDGAHFKKTELPMDHPNGMCTMEPVVAEDMVDQLVDWFNSPDGTYPEIDLFASNFGYNASKFGTVQDFINKHGTSTKSPNAWFNSLTPTQKAEAKLLKEQSGLTWNKWYEKYIYAGDGSNLVAKPKVTARVYNSVSMSELKTMAKAQSYNVKHRYTWDEVDELVTKGVIDSKTADAYLRGFTSLDDMNIHEYLYNYYVGTGNSFSINRTLRQQGFDALGITDQNTVKYMDLALNKTTLEKDIELFRFLDDGFLTNTFKSSNVNDIASQIGNVYENKQYMSSTIAYNPYFYHRPAIMRIQCESGTHAIPTTNYEEGEIILGRDTNYQLVDVIDHKHSPLKIEMDGNKYTYNGIEIIVKMLK